jgi:hypothetical protein
VVSGLANATLAIDISRRPDVLTLAEEVVTSGRPRILRKGGVELVVMMPFTPNRTAPQPGVTTEEAFARAAGTWPEEFGDEVQHQVRQSRNAQPKPPVEL